VERKHCHIIDSTLPLLADSHVSKTFYDEACQIACYLINRLPTLVLRNLSPYQKLFKSIPDYKFLRIFGCACFPNLRPCNNHKFEFHSKKCVFMSYSSNHKGYCCFHIESRKFYVSCDLKFHETIFPFSKTQPVASPPFSTSSHAMVLVSLQMPPLVSSNSSHPPTELSLSSTHHNISNVLDSTLVPLTSARTHSMTTQAQHNIRCPRQFADGIIRYPLPYALLTIQALTLQEPTCYSTTICIPEWHQAMKSEFNALLANNTWSLVHPSIATSVVGCKWVFKLKHKADGMIECHKAHLVAKGFHQQAGINYGETFSPVVKPTTIRTVLSIAYSRGWAMRQIDIQNAFLHGFLFEKVYMSQPHGFEHPSLPKHLCKLNKALYGLKQAPRAWFSRLNGNLISLGFIGSKTDSLLFTYKSGKVTIYILIYVNDIIITASNSASI
jgi:hypothetical protein